MWNEKGCFYFTVMCAEVQLYLRETQTFYLLFLWLHFLHFFHLFTVYHRYSVL